MRHEADDFPELVRAREIAPHITANAITFEKNRCLSQDVVKLMVDAGFIQMAIPKEYGGAETVSYTHLKLPTTPYV